MRNFGTLSGTDTDVQALTGRRSFLQPDATFVVDTSALDVTPPPRDTTGVTGRPMDNPFQKGSSASGADLPFATPAEWGIIAVGVGLLALMVWAVIKTVRKGN